MLSVDAADDDGSDVDDFFSLFIVKVLLTSTPLSNGNSVMMVPVLAFAAVVVTGVTVKVSGIEVIARGMASEETVTGTAVAGTRFAAVVPPWSVLSTEPLEPAPVAGRTSTVLAPREPAFPSVEVLLSASSRLVPSLVKVVTELLMLDGRMDFARAAVADWPACRVLETEFESSSLMGASNSVPTTGRSLLYCDCVDAG